MNFDAWSTPIISNCQTILELLISHYTEGDYYTYFRMDTISKTDTTRLTLHCGTIIKLPHLTDSTFIIERTSELERSGTQRNGRYWRELNFSRGINIFYQEATADERNLLDEVIEKLQKQIKTGR